MRRIGDALNFLTWSDKVESRRLAQRREGAENLLDRINRIFRIVFAWYFSFPEELSQHMDNAEHMKGMGDVVTF
jgi:hypothetical protein